MDPNLANARKTSFDAARGQTVTSAHFEKRARLYRLAAAVTDAPRVGEMFSDLATLFDRLADDFRRLEMERSRLVN